MTHATQCQGTTWLETEHKMNSEVGMGIAELSVAHFEFAFQTDARSQLKGQLHHKNRIHIDCHLNRPAAKD